MVRSGTWHLVKVTYHIYGPLRRFLAFIELSAKIAETLWLCRVRSRRIVIWTHRSTGIEHRSDRRCSKPLIPAARRCRSHAFCGFTSKLRVLSGKLWSRFGVRGPKMKLFPTQYVVAQAKSMRLEWFATRAQSSVRLL